MVRIIHDAPEAQPPGTEGIFGSIVVRGDIAHALLVVHDTEPPSVMRQVRVEALVGDRWVPCMVVSVGGGAGSDGLSALALSWRAIPQASKYACTF
ncbi:hypothetical protein [Pedococcus sp. P5_B7]